MSPRKTEFTERINVFFTPEQMERVKAEAEKLGLTVSAYVRMVVVKEVNRNG
jgi:predicted DNA binding CopG/RHH family protein